MQEAEMIKHERLLKHRILVFLLAFPLLILLGLLMRLHQAGRINVGIGEFYTYMTLHGMGMTILTFSTVLAVLWHVLGRKYVRLNPDLGRDLFYTELLGFLLIVVGGLIGKFAGGWYFLYPLPFKASFWTSWSVGMTYFALLLIILSWFVTVWHLIKNLLKVYGSKTLTRWKGRGLSGSVPMTVFTAILSLGILVLVLSIGIVLSLLYLLVYFLPSIELSPLLMQDMAMVLEEFLRIISILITMSWLSSVISEVSGREWLLNRNTAYSWFSSAILLMIAVLVALLNHRQSPELWQLLTSFAILPVTIITFSSVWKQSKGRRRFAYNVIMAFLVGAFGWLISVIADLYGIFQLSFYKNTLWYNAQFHTAILMGVVIVLFGFFFSRLSSNVRSTWLLNIGFKILLLGFVGFLAMFYLAGNYAVPRRYSDYTVIRSNIVQNMALITAEISSVFAGISLLGLVLLYIILFRKDIK